MKKGFPGDKEFLLENYWMLPYTYVLEAINELNKLIIEELHSYERPISMLAYQNAEINRDRKKQRTPYKLDDFYFYRNEEQANLPEPKYGAATLALISKGMFPGWALFVYKDLKQRAGDALPPEVLCVQCEDAIILAPSIEEMSITGLLIAGETASDKPRTLVSPCGLEVEVIMPKLSGKFQALEDAELRLIRSPKKKQLK